MDETSFASLSPSLLARKGGARPAMRPQHGGMLGGSVPAADASSSDEGLDDLGWNDMGDDDADIIQLTPAPANEQTAAEAREQDELTGATLAGFALQQSPARDQQEVLAKRLEKTSPPILSDAIMTDDECSDDEYSDEEGFDSEEVISETALAEDALTDHTAPHVVQAEDELEVSVDTEQEAIADELAGDLAGDAPFVAPAAFTPIVATKPAKKTTKSTPVRRVAKADQGKRAAFTLRLDPERHLKLRLASTIRGRSAQQIVTDALDAYLGDMPDLESLASQVKRT